MEGTPRTHESDVMQFCNSNVGQQLHDPKYGYQLMSDTYIVNDIKAEFANK